MKATWTPSWDTEKRVPAFINDSPDPFQAFGGTKYLWGNMPAIDVLALESNEGVQYNKDLDLLFAGKANNTIARPESLTSSGVCQLLEIFEI